MMTLHIWSKKNPPLGIHVSDVGALLLKTRLISIVSKPIKVVVVAIVIVVVVFIKKIRNLWDITKQVGS